MAERCNNCNWDRGIHAHRHAHSCLHLYAHVSWTLMSREVLYLNQVEILMEIYQQTQRTTHTPHTQHTHTTHTAHTTHTTRTHTSSSYAEEVQTFRKTNVKGKSETKIEIFHSFVERVRRRRWMQCPPWQTLPLFPILFSLFTAPSSHFAAGSPALSVSCHIRSPSRSINVSLALSPSHTYTHTRILFCKHFAWAKINFKFATSSFSFAHSRSLLLFFLVVHRLALFTWTLGTLWPTSWTCQNYPIPSLSFDRPVCQKSLLNRFPTWLLIYSCCSFTLYKKTEWNVFELIGDYI